MWGTTPLSCRGGQIKWRGTTGAWFPTAQSLEPEAKALPNFPFFILHFHFFKGYRRDTGRTAGELRRQWIFYPLKRARSVLYRAAPTVSLRKNPAHFKQSRRSCEVRAPSAQGIWKKIHWRPHKALIFI